MIEPSEAMPSTPVPAIGSFAAHTQHGVERGYEIDPYAVADTILRRLSASRGARRLPFPDPSGPIDSPVRLQPVAPGGGAPSASSPLDRRR